MWPDSLAFGGDYNPDQWPEDVWNEDISLMRAAGVNLVTIGVFAWSIIEPEAGRYDFSWLDRVIDTLHAGGIGVDLATATATPPPWLIARHPEIKPVTADGVRLEFGSRQGYCPSSPIFRDHAVALVRELADRYGTHPAVRLWHISNEYGDHITECFCDVSQEHFRRWLAERYGTVGALNDAWGTRHWGQVYGSIDQIPAPRRMPGPANPSHLLDWRRFSSDALLELLRAETSVLRDVTPNVPVTTNFMSMFYSLDYWRFAAELDVVTDDAYPDPADPHAHLDAARNYDLMRSLGRRKPWLLLEQAPSAVSWRPINVPKRPGIMRLGSYQAIARGSDGALFFQWRAPRFGSELHHSTMLPAAGTETRIFREITALGTELAAIDEVAGTRITADAAIILDWDNWWALDADESMPSVLMRWRAALQPFYRALYHAGVTIDFVRPDDDLAEYRLVVAPNSYLLREADANRWNAYVAAGGTLLVGPFSGVVNGDAHAHCGGAPGPLADLLGVRVDEVWPLAENASAAIDIAGSVDTATIWTEWLRAADADVVGAYTGGVLDGLPALTRKKHGAGSAWYVSYLPVDAGPVCDLVLAACGIVPAPDGIERVERSDGTTSYLFLLNHGDTAVDAAAPVGEDLITGAVSAGQLRLPPRGVAIVRHGAAAAAATRGDNR